MSDRYAGHSRDRSSTRRPFGFVAHVLPAILLSPLLFTPIPVYGQATLETGVLTSIRERPYDHATMAPVVQAAPLVGSIDVDGIPDEAAWGAAEPFTDFTQLVPDEGQPASEGTEVRILVGPHIRDPQAVFVEKIKVWDIF